MEPKYVGTADLFKMRDNTLRLCLHGHNLPAGEAEDHIVIRNVCLLKGCHGITYPYSFKSAEGCPRILSDMLPAGLYVWDSRACKGSKVQLEAIGGEKATLRQASNPKRKVSDQNRSTVNHKKARKFTTPLQLNLKTN